MAACVYGREKIKTALQAAKVSEQGLTAISLMERANTVRTLPELNASSGYMKMPGYMSRASMEEVGIPQDFAKVPGIANFVFCRRKASNGQTAGPESLEYWPICCMPKAKGVACTPPSVLYTPSPHPTRGLL